MEGGTELGKGGVDKESDKAVGPLVVLDNEASISSSGRGELKLKARHCRQRYTLNPISLRWLETSPLPLRG